MRQRRSPVGRILVLALVMALVAVGCGGGGGGPSNPRGAITVSAAASLRNAFTELGESFTGANPDTEVIFNFDSSSSLANQIIEGAPVDVFASADQQNMARLMYLEAVKPEVEVFTRNQMVLVTKPGIPEGITSVADLDRVGGVVSLCGEAVPCGRYATAVLANAGVELDETRVTRGQNATATLTAVTEGDAVAALVYASDGATAGSSVEIIEIPTELGVTAGYPIAMVAASANKTTAEAFMAYVLSDAGQAVLARHGFLTRS